MQQFTCKWAWCSNLPRHLFSSLLYWLTFSSFGTVFTKDTHHLFLSALHFADNETGKGEDSLYKSISILHIVNSLYTQVKIFKLTKTVFFFTDQYITVNLI